MHMLLYKQKHLYTEKDSNKSYIVYSRRSGAVILIVLLSTRYFINLNSHGVASIFLDS